VTSVCVLLGIEDSLLLLLWELSDWMEKEKDKTKDNIVNGRDNSSSSSDSNFLLEFGPLMTSFSNLRASMSGENPNIFTIIESLNSVDSEMDSLINIQSEKLVGINRDSISGE